MDSIDRDLRIKINKKFHSLNQKFNPKLEWRDTILSEEEDLMLFLLTRPTINDLQEFLQEKIVNWTMAQGTLEKTDERYKLANKRITCYEMLIGFTDQLTTK